MRGDGVRSWVVTSADAVATHMATARMVIVDAAAAKRFASGGQCRVAPSSQRQAQEIGRGKPMTSALNARTDAHCHRVGRSEQHAGRKQRSSMPPGAFVRMGCNSGHDAQLIVSHTAIPQPHGAEISAPPPPALGKGDGVVSAAGLHCVHGRDRARRARF